MQNGDDYCVYVHTTPDGRKYVGKAKGDPRRRWQSGHGYVGSWFHRCAITEFGWDNITHDVIESNLSNDDALALEEYYTRKFHSYAPGYGFNDNVANKRCYCPIRVLVDGSSYVFAYPKECTAYFGDIKMYSITYKLRYSKNGRIICGKYEIEYVVRRKENDIFPYDP